MSSPAETAETRPPPTARMLTEANWAAPPKTRIDIAIAAQAPMTGSASTPKDMPIASVGRTNGSAARMPSARVSGGSSRGGAMSSASDTSKVLMPVL